MRHPSDGTLRRLLDEPAGVGTADREHVAGCAVCLSGLAAAREDAEAAQVLLDVEVAADVDAGWRRLAHATAVAEALPTPASAPARRRRAALRSPVVVGVGLVALMTGVSAAAAADWLQIFHTEKVAPVALSRANLVALPDLSSYGDVRVAHEPRVREVADANAAQEATGLVAPQVEQLPRGVTGAPVFEVGERVSAVFTFSAAKAARAAAEAGETLPPPPPGLDGSRFRLVAGPGLAEVWSEARGVPALVVARAVAPTAYSSGVPFETARDYLLSLPGLPERLASRLRSFTGDGSTLPLPVPADQVETSTAEVDGAPATVLTTRDGTLAGVVWVDDGTITAVAGSLSADEALSVARALRVRP